ncbi:MAG: primosomal protein N' [Proteobacteria bacterium]|nr:primosomal protein N' [Pseudomonadota bacterium]
MDNKSQTHFNAGGIVCVLIPNAVNAGYDYRLNAAAAVGAFVRVNVQNRPYVGVIAGPGVSGLPPEKIKPIQHVFSAADFGVFPPPRGGELGLSEHDIRWIHKMSEWTMMAPGAVLRLILNIPDAFAPPRTEALFTYKPLDADGRDENGKKIRTTLQRQAVADAFAENTGEALSAADITQIAHVSPAVVRTMIKNGILEPAGDRMSAKFPSLMPTPRDTTSRAGAPVGGAGSDGNDSPPSSPAATLPPKRGETRRSQFTYFDTGTVKLNDEQRAAAIAIELGRFSVHLLDGITGSGKTQVYFDAAWRAYAAGRSVLLMMPEIALTAQFMSRFAQRFGAPPVIWHSNLTAAKRRDIWRGVATGQIRMVVGTRSALFLPWRDLGLIVVDEEHDSSYKQEDMGNYHARDMAILRGSIANFPIILSSATPSAETMKNVQSGNYKISKLTARFGGATMPTIELIDMRKERPEKY